MADDIVGIKVTGAKEIRRIAKRAGNQDSRDALKKGHKEIAGLVVPVAKSNAPKRTGRLAGNIRPLGSVTKAQVAAGGSRVPYAGVIHGGWPAHNIEPNPYITDAVSTEFPEIIEVLETLYFDVADQLSTGL